MDWLVGYFEFIFAFKSGSYGLLYGLNRLYLEFRNLYEYVWMDLKKIKEGFIGGFGEKKGRGN